MNKISITAEMINGISELDYKSQINIIMYYIEYFLRGNMEIELTELEQFIINTWIDDELARNNYTIRKGE